MGKVTGIAWCRSTRNLWTGCTEVGPGCFGCYAKANDQRFYGGIHWGPGAPRLPHLDGAAKDLRSWDRKARASGEAWTVFINSQSDFFDNEVPQEWREAGYRLFKECSALTFIIVTKRIGNAKAMLPADWGGGYPNVWLLVTVVDQKEADRDIPKLLSIPAALHGVSHEPALGPIDYERILWPSLGGHRVDVLRGGYWNKAGCLAHGPSVDLGEPKGGFTNHSDMEYLIKWVIVGGESRQPGSEPREFDVAWAMSSVAQGKETGVPVLVKQLGAKPIGLSSVEAAAIRARNAADPAEWPINLRVQQIPQMRKHSQKEQA